MSDTPPSTRHRMQQSGQFHDSAALPLEVAFPVPIEKEYVWAGGPVRTVLRRKCPLTPAGKLTIISRSYSP